VAAAKVHGKSRRKDDALVAVYGHLQ
jgi:hypothetical protein